METQKSDSIWARIARARVPAIVLLLLLSSFLAEATHFRYGYISWSRDRTYSGPGYKIDFKVTESWRRGFPWNGYYGGNVLNPGVGDSINFGGNFPFRFGDGASANIVLKITEIPAVDVINGVFNVSHIYTTTGSKLAYFEGAARFSTSAGLMNNGDGSFRVETNVTVGNNNDAPVSTLPPIINMIAGISNATYQIPASDPDGDSIYFSLAPSSSFTQGGFSGNTQPPGFSVSSTGLITFNTVGKLAGKLYNAVVRLTDAKGAYVHLDFLIKLTNNSAPPVWDYGTTPANNHVFNLTPGQNVTFTLKANDADSTDYLTIFGNGVPIGATNTPALPAVGAVDSAVQSTFSWTPTNSQLGQYITTFIAQDPQGVQTPTTVKFFVCNVSLGDSITNVSCFGGNNGAIDLTPTGGVGTLTYNWGGGITSQDRTNLPAGTYTVTMSDSLSCSVTQTFVVTEPASALTASSSNTAILCNGGTSIVTVSGAGGTSPYTGTGAQTPVMAGNYSYTVTDANGCTASTTGTITEPSLLTASSSNTAILCNGGTSIVTVSGAGGTSPYTGTGAQTPVMAGNYSYTVTDANGCTASTTGTITEPSLLTASSSNTAILCNGGTSIVTVSGAGGTSPYTGTGAQTPVMAGNYSYTVTDANGCTASTTGTITEPSLLTASSSNTAILCNGGSSIVMVSGSGGTSPYTGTGAQSPVMAGNYSYTVTDANGCTATTTGTISEPALLVVSGTVTNVTCFGGSNGSIDISVSGGTSPYGTVWSNSATTEDLSGLIAGNYSVNVEDANGCTAAASYNVSQPASLPVASITTSNADAFCNAVQLTGHSTDSGSSYAWTYNSAAFAATQSVRLKVGDSDGVYTLVVTNLAGCQSAGASYNFQKQGLAAMYVLIGFRDVDLAKNNDVYNGSVGVTSAYGDADFDKYCSVASPGAFVKAHDIDVKSNVTIPTKIFSPAVVTLPTMLLNTASLSGLSNYTKTSNGTVSGNYRDLCIWSNKTVTITGNVFRNIKIGHNCDVTFTASDISLEELEIDHSSTVHFAGNTIFRVKDHVDIDKGCDINPEAKKVTFYIKDPSTSSHGCYSSYHNWYGSRWGSNDFEVDGQQTTVIANVYAPDGKIRVHGNGYNCHWNSNQSCTMTGLFIAEQIESDGKNVSWYSYDCGSSMMRKAAPMAQQEEAVAYELLVYPNPTDAQVTLQFASMEQPADVSISDMAGRVVRHQIITAQSALSSTFDLSDQAAGVYLIQVRQGENSFRTKLILK